MADRLTGARRRPASADGAIGRRAGVLAVLGAAVLWGTLGVAQELGAPSAAPASFAAVRSLAGGTLLALTVIALGRGHRLRRAVAVAPGAAATSALAIGVFQLGYLTGIRQVGVALGTLVAIGSAPAAAGVLAVVAGRRPSRRWLWATAVTVAGSAVLLLAGEELAVAGGSATLGVLAGLLAGVSFGIYTTVSKRLLDAGADGSAVVTLAFVGAGVLLAPALAVSDMSWLASPRGIVTALWLAVGTTTVGYLLFARGLRILDAPSVTTLTLAEPLTATVLAVVVIGERPTALGALGGVLLLVGLAAVGGRPVPTDPAAGTRLVGR